MPQRDKGAQRAFVSLRAFVPLWHYKVTHFFECHKETKGHKEPL
ncbi:Uncharacterized protein dnm_026710 [Desulfonema magnum]|uniref:Uncharacterized protein n=1 Tax=Desulfonema magnum TaxID=45655 RepID=A0A975BJC5_9BACT|nr:Uncharacterized protein dnm_026710 [Desulfonema magnum]